MKPINVNHTAIYLNEFGYGKTQNIVIKIGHKLHYLDVEKDATMAYVQMYGYAKDRKSVSKYASGCLSVFCEPNAILNREFFEQVEEIEKAQSLMRHFCGVVK